MLTVSDSKCGLKVELHADVSSKNMLVDRDFSIRVADFGMSRQRRKAMLSAKSQGGTAEWTAPEVLRGLPYHEKADIFSFGVVLHELMTQTVPWSELSTIQVGHDISEVTVWGAQCLCTASRLALVLEAVHSDQCPWLSH